MGIPEHFSEYQEDPEGSRGTQCIFGGLRDNLESPKALRNVSEASQEVSGGSSSLQGISRPFQGLS